MTDPFRDELEAAHRRIEKIEGEHRARVAELERENQRLRGRLIEVAPSRTKTGRVFLSLAMLLLGVSVAAGIVYARIAKAPASGWAPAASQGPIELGVRPTVDAQDFDREGTAKALDAVRIDDCVDPSHRPGSGHVVLAIAASGLVMSAVVDQGPYVTTSEGRCIENRYRNLRVPSFASTSFRSVGKTFDVH